MIEKAIDKTISELNEKFKSIKNQGYIEGKSQGCKGNSGLTFEKLLGKENNEFQIADYDGIEIKVKGNKRYSYRYLTLFNLVPSNCFGIGLKKIRQNYGIPDKYYNDINILMGPVFANKKTNINGFLFQLLIDYKIKKIYLCIYDKNSTLIEKDSYWEFGDIISAIERKLNYLSLIKYDQKLIDNKKYFKYTDILFYKFKGNNIFFELLEKGLICIYICLGVYKSGHKAGKEHDYGIRFDIRERNLLKLYNEYKIQ